MFFFKKNEKSERNLQALRNNGKAYLTNQNK